MSTIASLNSKGKHGVHDINSNNNTKNINNELQTQVLTIDQQYFWIYGDCDKYNKVQDAETIELAQLKHLLFFCICSWKYNHFFNDKDFLCKSELAIFGCNSNLQPFLNVYRLKHLSKYCIKNYNVNQQNKMKNRGVLLSNIEKIQFTNENVVLVFNKFDKLNQRNQRKILWERGEQCQRCKHLMKSNALTFWINHIFTHYINDSVNYAGLSFNKVLKSKLFFRKVD